MSPELVILLVGICVAVSCALIGCFLLLRQLTLLGDAISHAVLPGIVIGFLLTGSREPLPMFLGAGAFGVLTVFLVDLFLRSRRLREDASIGVVFPGLFALGVILVSRYASAVDLDIECVLYGEIAYAPWDTWSLFGVELGPKPLWVTAGTLLLDLVVVIALFKELKLSSFDPRLAAALGYSPVLLHYLLMTLTSVTVVGAFESVGAILVVAMLIVPAATAYLITDRLPRMLWLASLVGTVAAVSGYFLARALDASIAGSMAVCAGLQFLLVLLFAPTYGVIGRWLVRRRLMRRLSSDLLLGKLTTDRAVRAAELAQRFGWAESRIRRALQRLEREQQVEQTPDGFRRRVEVSIEQVTLHDLGR